MSKHYYIIEQNLQDLTSLDFPDYSYQVNHYLSI
jgi:hypothetical protein